MSYSVKRLLRDAVYTDLNASIGSYVNGVQIVKAFDGEQLESQHIRIATPTASPHRSGNVNLGIWTVTVNISAVTQIDAADNDVHDNLAGLIEAYCLQSNVTLSASITDANIKVDNVFMGVAQEMAIEGMRYSSQELEIECYML